MSFDTVARLDVLAWWLGAGDRHTAAVARQALPAVLAAVRAARPDVVMEARTPR